MLNRREFSTSRVTSATTLTSLAGGIEGLQTTLSALPVLIAEQLKTVLPTVGAVSGVPQSAPTPVVHVEQQSTGSFMVPFSIPQDLWNRLPDKIRYFLTCKRNNTTWTGTANDLFISDMSLFRELPYEVRQLKKIPP
jgi:hypothetical protein